MRKTFLRNFYNFFDFLRLFIVRGFLLSEGGIMYFISQIGKQDCAFACLKMMLANYHHDKNYLFLPLPNEKSATYNFQELTSLGKKYNLTLQGVRINDVQELFSCKEFPLIASLRRPKGARHSVLLLGANEKYVKMFDPEVGKRKVRTEIFVSEWTGLALKIVEGTKTKCPLIFPSFISRRDKIILPILQLFSGAGLLAGTYFISENQKFYLPIIFFSVFLIFEILFRSNLVSAMKRMDENIFEFGFREQDRDYREIYETIERYRQISLSIVPNVIYSSLLAIFITAIMVINGPINVVYIVLPLALAAIKVFLYKPHFKSQNIDIAEKEKEIEEVEDDFQFKTKSSDVHSLAYEVGLNHNVYTYLEVASLLLTIILTMTISRNINITYVIFYLCISVYLKNTFEKIFDFSSQSEEFDIVRNKLFNSLEFKDKNS